MSRRLAGVIAVIAAAALLLSLASSSSAFNPQHQKTVRAPNGTIYLSHPWSGTITYDFRPDPAISSDGSSGRVVTTMHLTQAGKLAPTGTLTQYGTWTTDIDLNWVEDCRDVHVSGTHSGIAKVFSWDWRGHNTFYLSAGPAPQPSFQIPFTRSADTCDSVTPAEKGTLYWLLQTGDEEQWYHHAGQCAHTLSGFIHPGIGVPPSPTTTVRYQLTQLPDANSDGIPDGGTATTGTCTAGAPPPPPPPPGRCGSSVENGCPPPDPYQPGAQDSYSMSGVCGKAATGSMKGQPRCYILLGQKTILAVKHHEANFMQLANAKAGAIAEAMGEKALKSQIKSQLITVALKKFAGAGAAEANSALSLGKTLASAISAAIFATNWHYLGLTGYPPKCFSFRVTYNNGKPKPEFDPVFSFIRTWDKNNPPTIGRGITTSNSHWWDENKGHIITLPLFCRGPFAQAVTTGSEVPAELLSPPYVKFSIDFSH